MWRRAADQYITEKYAMEISQLLAEWAEGVAGRGFAS